MATNWEAEGLTKLASRLKQIAPVNLAPIPIAMALAYDEEAGEVVWTVDAMARTESYEVDASASDPELHRAIRAAYISLNNWRSYAHALD